jgi:hypothetical protein
VHFIPEKIWIFSGFDSLTFVNQNLDGAGINSPYGKVKRIIGRIKTCYDSKRQNYTIWSKIDRKDRLERSGPGVRAIGLKNVDRIAIFAETTMAHFIICKQGDSQSPRSNGLHKFFLYNDR